MTWQAMATTLRELGFSTGRIIEQGLRPFTISERLPTLAICNVWFTQD